MLWRIKIRIVKTVKKFFEPGETLSHKVKRGSLWIFLSRGIGQLTRLINVVILARLLSPSDFGLMGIAGITMGVIEVITNPGFREALIQRKGDIKEYLDAAWTISILRGLVLFCIIFLLAPYVALFFESPKAESVIRVVSFTVLFHSLTNVGVIYFIKDLDFRKQFIFDLSMTISNVLVAIPLAYVLGNVWALVFGLLSGAAAKSLVSYIIHPYRPSFTLNLESVKELFNYGKWITSSNILVLLLNKGDSALVGKLLGTSALGFYQVAFNFSTIPATEISEATYKLTFPAYSQLQDNIERLKKGYLKILRFTSFISAPLAAGIFIMAPDFVRIFLGDKWTPAVSCIQVLSLWGFVRSVSSTTGPLFQAVGRPDLITKLVFVRFIIMAALIYPFSSNWGIAGTAMSVLLSALIVDPISCYLIIRIIKCEATEFSRFVFVPLINSALMVCFIFILKTYFLGQIHVLGFFMLVILGAICYFVASYITEADIRNGIRYKAEEKEQVT